MVEIEVKPVEKVLSYDREVQCEIMDANMLKHLQTIKEEEDHEQEGRDMFAEMQKNSMVSPDKRRGSSIKQQQHRGSFLKGSFIGFEDVPVETEEMRREREAKELAEKFQVLSKEDAQKEYGKKDFGEFISKTSRIMERALDQEFDIIGDFFVDDDDENEKKKVVKGEKITQ